MSIIILIISIIIAYLLGSINFAILVSYLFKLQDPRSYGSRNPGTTNILRAGDKVAAVITLLGDGLKGVVAVLIGYLFGIYGFGLGLVALAAFFGHLYPIFHKFKGGKGVATMLGVLLALNLVLGFLAIISWLLIAIIFRYSSLAALTAALVAPISCLFISPAYFFPLVVITVFIIYSHRGNIKKLKRGQESKISFKR